MSIEGQVGEGGQGEIESGVMGGAGCDTAGADEGDERGNGQGGERRLEGVVWGMEEGEGWKGKMRPITVVEMVEHER